MFSTHQTFYQGTIRAIKRSFNSYSSSSNNSDKDIDMEEYQRDHSGEEEFLVVSPSPRSSAPMSPSNLRRVIAYDTPPATPPPLPSKTFNGSSSPSLGYQQRSLSYQGVQKELPPLPSVSAITAPGTPSMAPVSAVITTIATGTPPTSRSQEEVAAQVSALYGPESPYASKIPRIYANTRINTRHKAVDPLDPEFDRNMPIRQRMDLFLTHAGPLCVDVARQAISSPASGISSPAEDIGLLVVVTSTGFIAPGVDVAVVQGLGLSRSVKRVIINFMGCAAAMNGIRTAADYAIAQQYAALHASNITGKPVKAKKALLVCVELSSVNGVFSDSINDVIISSLFGDGCAAMVIGATTPTIDDTDNSELSPGQILLGPSFSQLIDETNGLDTSTGIILGVNSNGITCDLSPKLPSYIRSAVGPVLEGILAENSLEKDDIQHWAIHPGGPKIIEESLVSLDLPDEVASTSWDVLAKYGNMLSVSLPFVLKSMVEARLSEKTDDDSDSTGTGTGTSKGVAFSFGPGITIEGVLFDIVV